MKRASFQDMGLLWMHTLSSFCFGWWSLNMISPIIHDHNNPFYGPEKQGTKYVVSFVYWTPLVWSSLVQMHIGTFCNYDCFNFFKWEYGNDSSVSQLVDQTWWVTTASWRSSYGLVTKWWTFHIPWCHGEVFILDQEMIHLIPGILLFLLEGGVLDAILQSLLSSSLPFCLWVLAVSPVWFIHFLLKFPEFLLLNVWKTKPIKKSKVTSLGEVCAEESSTNSDLGLEKNQECQSLRVDTWEAGEDTKTWASLTKRISKHMTELDPKIQAFSSCLWVSQFYISFKEGAMAVNIEKRNR